MRSSYSQNNTYVSCPQHWDWSYNKKLMVNGTSSALYFGSAVDAGAMKLLQGHSNYMQEFESLWTNAKNYGGGADIPLFDNPDIQYSPSDFDSDLLDTTDKALISTWQKQLNVKGVDPIETVAAVSKVLKNKHVASPSEYVVFFNRCCWLSLKKKGQILIESFKDQFMPKVKKILSVQESAKIVDSGTGDTVSGYLDFVAEIEGYNKPIIWDLKTASKPYTQAAIDLTEQLTLYYAMVGEKYDTDLVGYVVLSKNINKVETNVCSSCGHIQKGKHKTCDAMIAAKRCGASWIHTKTISPEVQILVQQKTPKQKQQLLLGYGNIMAAMKNDIIYRNTDKCNNWYGRQCPYYDACHNDDLTGLVKK